jgi:protease-4
MTWDEVDAIGRGRVFTGSQALENGLVDVVGGFDVALAEAKRLAGIDADADVRLVDYPKAKPWWQQLLNRRSDEQVALESILEDYETFVTTGRVPFQGEVRMPPLVVE